MTKLTEEFVEHEIEAPLSGQRFYRDEIIPGFALRVTPKSKSYIFEKRVGGTNLRMTLGKCNEISFDEAKTKAFIAHGEIAKGNDPRTGKRISTKYDITLREVFDKFLETKPLREATQKGYISIMKLFDDWLELPITSITKDMVEQRHKELTTKKDSGSRKGKHSDEETKHAIYIRR